MTTPTPLPKYIYKILPPSPPPSLPLPLALPVSDLDKRDNFIHLSTSAQILGTLRNFFRDEEHVYILRIPYEGVSRYIIWEDTKGTPMLLLWYLFFLTRLKLLWVGVVDETSFGMASLVPGLPRHAELHWLANREAARWARGLLGFRRQIGVLPSCAWEWAKDWAGGGWRGWNLEAWEQWVGCWWVAF